MSQTLTLEISEEIFAVIQQEAAKIGVVPERLAATLIEQQFAKASELPRDDAESKAARIRFESHFGTLRLETTMSVDNDSVDADLAREYASNHERE